MRPRPARAAANIEGMRKALMRSNTRMLLSAVLLFQFTAMLLIALQEKPVDMQALALAIALPAVTWAVAMAFGRLWPIDRAILILVMLLCSVGIITLSDIARAKVTPLTQAIYALIGIGAMAVGIVFIRSVHNWKKWILPGVVLCLGALASPWAFGSVQNGARNWITIIPDKLTVQPSEFIKPALILILAASLAGRPRFVKCLPAIGFAAVCCGILLVQSDLGAVLLYFLTTLHALLRRHLQLAHHARRAGRGRGWLGAGLQTRALCADARGHLAKPVERPHRLRRRRSCRR